MIVVCAGTATDIGKTFVGAHVLAGLRVDGVEVHARKPAQSFAPGEVTDAEILTRATGEPVDEVCPRHRWYPVPMAPPMAAAALDRPPFTIADLVADLALPATGITWIETAGGPRSPLADDGDAVELCAQVHPDAVVLVADAGLGTINAVRLSVAALSGWPVVVVLNRYDPGVELHRRNRAWLTEREHLDVVTELDVLVRRLRP